VVREGVRFGSHNDPVRVLIAFATPDRSAHIDLLRQLAEILARADELAQAAARLGTPEQWKELVRSLIQNPP
jgi:PTS system ascorbate-specific IIA component